MNFSSNQLIQVEDGMPSPAPAALSADLQQQLMAIVRLYKQTEYQVEQVKHEVAGVHAHLDKHDSAQSTLQKVAFEQITLSMDSLRSHQIDTSVAIEELRDSLQRQANAIEELVRRQSLLYRIREWLRKWRNGGY